jgi:hypothetical protein
MDEGQDIDNVDRQRPRGQINLADAPTSRAALDTYPRLWPRIFSAVPTGWDTDVAQALIELAQLSAETGVEIDVAQINSKLAGLRLSLKVEEGAVGPLEVAGSTPLSTRFHSSANPGSVRDRARAIVAAAAARCATRCERCGANAALVNKQGWLVTACPTHARPDLDERE